MSKSSLVILAASVLRYRLEKQTHEQTDRHTNAADRPIHTTAVCAGNKSVMLLSSGGVYCSPYCRQVLVKFGVLTETDEFDQDSSPPATWTTKRI